MEAKFLARVFSFLSIFLAIYAQATVGDDDDSSEQQELESAIYYGDSNVNLGESFSITCIIPITDPIHWLKDGEPITRHNLRHGRDEHSFILSESAIDGEKHKIEAHLSVRHALKVHEGKYQCNPLHSSYHMLRVRSIDKPFTKSPFHNSDHAIPKFNPHTTETYETIRDLSPSTVDNIYTSTWDQPPPPPSPPRQMSASPTLNTHHHHSKQTFPAHIYTNATSFDAAGGNQFENDIGIISGTRSRSQIPLITEITTDPWRTMTTTSSGTISGHVGHTVDYHGNAANVPPQYISVGGYPTEHIHSSSVPTRPFERPMHTLQPHIQTVQPPMQTQMQPMQPPMPPMQRPIQTMQTPVQTMHPFHQINNQFPQSSTIYPQQPSPINPFSNKENDFLVPNYDNAEKQLKAYDIKSALVLSCNVTKEGDNKLTWEKEGIEVSKVPELSGRYRIIEAEKKFIIDKTAEIDDGVYSCVANNEKKDIHVYANVLVRVPSNTGVVEGEKLTISCTVKGTDPKLSWAIGNLTISNSTGRYILKEDANHIQNAIFSIENSNLEDRGEYKCIARNLATDYANQPIASDVSFVRVKGKLAALWPFLGICAEVLILCTIILIYEKRRNKTELEESDTDPNTEQKRKRRNYD